MRNKICSVCQLNHERLGVELRGRTLLRRTRGRAHRVRTVEGGAFGFSARFLEAHLSEIAEIVVHDLLSGEVFRADCAVMDHAERRTLSPAFGEQVLIPIRRMERTRTRPQAPSMSAEKPAAPPAGPTAASDRGEQLALL